MAIMKKAAPKADETKAEVKAEVKTPQFEEIEDAAGGAEAGADAGAATVTATATATVQAPADRIAEAAAAHAAKRDVATVGTRAVAAAGKTIISPFETMRDAFHVDYDTLLQVQAVQGQFFDKANDESLGEAITLEMLSFQKNFVIAPGEDGDEAAKLVKYSDDGITTKDGTDCKAYLQELKDAGYEKAGQTERSVLVGVLIDAGKVKELEGTLVQVDLAPTSKKQFDRYQIQAAYDTSKGKYTADEAKMLRLTCRVEKRDKLTWTVVQFARA